MNYLCDYCGRSFSQKTNRYRHMRKGCKVGPTSTLKKREHPSDSNATKTQKFALKLKTPISNQESSQVVMILKEMQQKIEDIHKENQQKLEENHKENQQKLKEIQQKLEAMQQRINEL